MSLSTLAVCGTAPADPRRRFFVAFSALMLVRSTMSRNRPLTSVVDAPYTLSILELSGRYDLAMEEVTPLCAVRCLLPGGEPCGAGCDTPLHGGRFTFAAPRNASFEGFG